MPADLLENFTKETGIEAELSLHATNEEIMGKVTAGGGARRADRGQERPARL